MFDFRLISFFFLLIFCYIPFIISFYQLPFRSFHSYNSFKLLSSSINQEENVFKRTPLTYYIETYGCQMNVADSDIVRSILMEANYYPVSDIEDANIILLNTCAIREHAEEKVFQRIRYLQSMKRKINKNKPIEIDEAALPIPKTFNLSYINPSVTLKKKPTLSSNHSLEYIGVLGCMAERIKLKLLEEYKIDFIAGPDAYRDLPHLLEHAIERRTNPKLFKQKHKIIPEINHIVNTSLDHILQPFSSEKKNKSTKFNPNKPGINYDLRDLANVKLSMDETYENINPVRSLEGNVHGFVTIMRGCDNHCAFCIVPYTRGKERSRSVQSILDEVKELIQTNPENNNQTPIKEIVLLGQNVNSYRDESSPSNILSLSSETLITPGFTQRSKPRRRSTLASSSPEENNDVNGVVTLPSEPSLYYGVNFGELLVRVAEIDPEVRIRFQSPHPKNFPDPILNIIADTPNLCKSLHIPAQHGNTEMLKRMQRGYTREAYLELIDRARSIMHKNQPIDYIGLGISTDLISGFCGETEEEHQVKDLLIFSNV